MQEIIQIVGLLVGFILLMIRRKTKNEKLYFYLGLIIVIISLALILPDAIRGFIDGYNESRILMTQ